MPCRLIFTLLLISLLFFTEGLGWGSNLLEDEGGRWLFVTVHNEEVMLWASDQESSLFGGLHNATSLGIKDDPVRFSYYSLENIENTPLTSQWINGISAWVDKILHRSTFALLVAVARERVPFFLSNLPYDVEFSAVFPKTSETKALDLGWLEYVTSSPLLHNADIQGLVDQVNEADLRTFVEYLSGEASNSPILTRNSYSTGAKQAESWIFNQFKGFGFTTVTQCYDSKFSCNVAGTLLGTSLPEEVIVIGAHYDSRAADASSPTQRAPGANDDGSGTGTLLQIAKIIQQSNTSFARTIQLVAFSGEEQGLLGSQAYASLMASTRTKVVAMIQNDMIAYRASGANLLCGFPQRYTTPQLTSVAISATNMYSPTVSTGRNDRCCSDHRSFYERGFPATDFSDTHGPIVDPQYHKSGDLVNRAGYDFAQYSGNVKGILATAAVLAEPN